jgi:hypothetical protein
MVAAHLPWVLIGDGMSEAYKPDDEAVATIKTQLVGYETRRAAADRDVRWLAPLSLVPAAFVALFGLAALVVADEPPLGSKDKLQFAYWVLLAVVLLGSGGFWLSQQPTKRLQQRLRDRMLPALFGFVGEVDYSHGVKPFAFDYIPSGVLPDYARAEFGDVVRGRHKWMPFELFEVHLRSGGKSKTTLFDGVIVAFEIPARFPGVLLATPRVGEWSIFFRDIFGAALTTIDAGDGLLDATFEFRTDNSPDARRLIVGPLGRALAPLSKAWREGAPRVALSQTTGFLVMPTTRDFFELPDVSISIDYDRHIAPMVAELIHLLDTALGVRRAMAGLEGADEEDGLLD